MIKVNLLPPELRRTVGTPPALFGVILVGVALLASVGCLYAYLWFSMLVLKEEHASLSQQVKQKEAQAEERNALQEDIKDYKERERSIVEMKTNRILWSRKLDSLVRLTPEDIWITRLKVKKPEEKPRTPGKKDKPTGGYLELHCYALGAKVTTMTEFRRRLMGEPEFWRFFLDAPIAPNDFSYGFAAISQPSWDRVKLEGFREENNIRFTIRLELLPDKEQQPADPKAI
jgi:Tfp pilus assembly protein PilN